MSVPELDASFSDRLKAWLAGEPDDDPVSDLATLHGHLLGLPHPLHAGETSLRCIAVFEQRLLDIADRLRPLLIDAPLPLLPAVREPHEALIAALLDLATVQHAVLEDVNGHWMAALLSDRGALAARILRLLGEAYLNACMMGAASPAGLWLRVAGVLGMVEHFDSTLRGRPQAALAAGARILAMAALQPESLAARELAWVHEYLQGQSGDAQVGRKRPEAAAALYWLDPARDQAPVAMARRAAPEAVGLLYFDTAGFARVAGERLVWLEQQVAQAETLGMERDMALLDVEGSGLPAGLSPLEALSLLRRMHERWSAPPQRARERRQQSYPVQVCAGLRAIWDLFRHGEVAARIEQWRVCNDSPGGYAIMSVSGLSGALAAGMVLALRSDAGAPWSLCIVRWIRADSIEQVELGLQVVAQGARAVMVGFRGDEAATMRPALVLSPLPGVRNRAAILLQSGSYASRRFVLMDEGEHLYVAQGRVLSLDMQTANVELLQYEIDPYPG